MYNKQLLHAFQSPTWLNSHPNAENSIQLLWRVWQLLDAIKSFQFSKYLKAEAILASCDLARPHLKAHPWNKHLLAVVKSQDINNEWQDTRCRACLQLRKGGNFIQVMRGRQS